MSRLIPFESTDCCRCRSLVPCLKCHYCSVRAFVFLASEQALLKYSEDGNHAIRTIHYNIIGENPMSWNAVLSLSCIIKHFKFPDCNNAYFMHLIYACRLIYHLVYFSS